MYKWIESLISMSTWYFSFQKSWLNSGNVLLKNSKTPWNLRTNSANRKIEKYQFCRACYFNLLLASRAEHFTKIFSHDEFLSTLRYKHQVLEHTFSILFSSQELKYYQWLGSTIFIESPSKSVTWIDDYSGR